MAELIEIHNLSKSYGKKEVLKNVDLNLSGGKIIGLLGPNGSGKTTLIKILNGLLKDYTGHITIDGQPIGVHSKELISYLPDEPIGGVDPAARDLILDVILSNYAEDAIVLLSTHLISDIEKIFDEVIFIKKGLVVLHEDSESLREKRQASIDEIFREEFKC